jgi:GNAT superfamily N-acetyltransferase
VVEVRFTGDPSRALQEAGTFLGNEPVAHNLILSLLHARVARQVPGRYWMAIEGGRVSGVVFQSPLHFSATITPMSPEAVIAMVDAIVDAKVVLPGVSGDAATAARFAGQFVFTPPELRHRGYARACVGELSRQLKAEGLRVMLFTDLANPTSNSIYRRIGYRAVGEALRYRFA